MGFETGTYQLTLVTATQHIPRLKELILELRYRLPDVASIMQNINPGRSPLIYGEETRLLWGDETIEEKLGSVRFSLSPRAFFQLNPEQTVKLYNLVREAAALTGRERVVDAYCGVGTIGLWLAPDAAEVRGMDVIPEAIGDAKRNAAKNGIDNVSYESGTAEELFPRWLAQGFQPDVIVVDPPRTGCGKDLLQAVAKAKPKRLLYVSCNPSTLAKDCDYLLKQGFNVEWIRPLDMFPQTSHVECIVLIKRAESRMK
jgi:23S rRNA (uracil-5-)-methyltransferase RumA